MLISDDIKLDYSDVLIKPKRSTLKSRKEVDLFRDTKPHLYMCGHDHCKSLIVKDDITLVVSGTGGESYDEPNVNLKNMSDCELDYFSPSLGVAILRIKNNSLALDFYNEKGFKEYSHKVLEK